MSFKFTFSHSSSCTIGREQTSKASPGSFVIYTIIKKTDPAPPVTKLSLGKQLRGRRVLLRRWGVENEIVEKSPAGGRCAPGISHAPGPSPALSHDLTLRVQKLLCSFEAVSLQTPWARDGFFLLSRWSCVIRSGKPAAGLWLAGRFSSPEG